MSRFAQTYCSQCGHPQGAGDNGYSSCEDHWGVEAKAYEAQRKAARDRALALQISKAQQARIKQENHDIGDKT